LLLLLSVFTEIAELSEHDFVRSNHNVSFEINAFIYMRIYSFILYSLIQYHSYE